VLSVVRAGFPGSLVEEYLIFESCARIPGESHITTDFLPLNIPTRSPTASVVLRAVRAWCPDFLPFNTHQVPPPPASCSALFLAGAMVLSWRNTGNCIFESDSGYIVTDFLSFNIPTRSPTARIILGAEVLPPPRTWQEARARHSPPVTGTVMNICLYIGRIHSLALLLPAYQESPSYLVNLGFRLPRLQLVDRRRFKRPKVRAYVIIQISI
jgi:hypothetical protein